MQHNIALWSATHKNGEILREQAFPHQSGDESIPLWEGLEAQIDLAVAEQRPPLFSVGNTYSSPKFHRKECWSEATGVLLIGDASQAETLAERIIELNMEAVLINALSTRKNDQSKRIAAFFSFDYPVASSGRITELASLIAQRLGLVMWTDGHAVTNLVRADPEGIVGAIDGIPFDSEYRDWAKFADWMVK